MNEYVLGADIGSGSVKLTLLSRTGEIAGTAGCEYPTFYPQVGWCEQDPEDWCKAFATALKTLLAETGVRAEEIKAIAPDAATHTAVLLDEDKKPVRHAILWTDQRSKQQANYLKENHLELIRTQTLNTPTTVWTLPQFMWLQQQDPQSWAKTRHILFAKDYLRFRLTGELATDTIDAAGSMFYDVMNECWSKQLCAIGNIDESWLPKLCDPKALGGEVTAQAAEEFGLQAGTKVL
ncbi:MAG: xylulokinase, partial [Oscillospiraceae bacterium]|nr:xylulokinase [Oscillospiraceae bacterium]